MRLRRLAPLDGDDIAALESQMGPIEALAPGDDLSPAGAPLFVVSGWAAIAHTLKDGRRQILAFVLPGDAVGLDLLTRARPGLAVVALTPIKARRVKAGVVMATERLTRAFAGVAADQQKRLVGHMVRLGRQTGYERVAHLLVELHDRLAQVGEAHGERFILPVKQEVVADALGLSLVHVNRTLQQLRREGLVEVRGAQVSLRDRAALAALSDQSR